MFRQLTAIFRGLHVPRKLLQYCLRLGRMWIVVRSVWPAVVPCNPWRRQLSAETCRGNLMSIIKSYNTLERLLVILHRKMLICYVDHINTSSRRIVIFLQMNNFGTYSNHTTLKIETLWWTPPSKARRGQYFEETLRVNLWKNRKPFGATVPS
jgi:hypothetical protein